MVEARNLGCRNGRLWLWRGLTMALRPGQICGLVGPNGAGKTTLIRCIAGLRIPDEGELSPPPRLGYVPQRTEIAFGFSVQQVVTMGLVGNRRIFSRLTAQDRQAVSFALDRVGLRDKSAQAFTDLSGGERQLVLIARALVGGAQVVILDEPLAALDLLNQARVLQLLRQLADDGIAVLLSTHDPNHLLAVAEQTLLLAPGAACTPRNTQEVLSPANLSDIYGLPLGMSQTGFGQHILPAYMPSQGVQP